MEPRKAFEQYFAEQGYKYETDEDGDFRLLWSGTPTDFRQFVVFSKVEGLDKVQVFCIPDSRVPLDHYWQTLDFLGCVNDHKAFAIWALDHENGAITAKYSILTDIGLSAEMARAACIVTRADMDDIMAGVMSICYGGKSGADAFADYLRANE